MKTKHRNWDWLGNTYNLDFYRLNFLVQMMEIFSSFNMEKTKRNEL